MTEIADLSDIAIVQLLMRHLSYWYSVGGVSLGRSFRSTILGRIINLFDFDYDILPEIGEEIVLDEAKRRIGAKNSKLLLQRSLPFCQQLSLVDSETLALIGLLLIGNWYNKKSKPLDYLLDKDIVNTAVALLEKIRIERIEIVFDNEDFVYSFIAECDARFAVLRHIRKRKEEEFTLAFGDESF